MKIAFDIGGVLGKYPDVFWKMIEALRDGKCQVYVITDIPDKAKALEILTKYGYFFKEEMILCADYAAHGERCKAVLVKEYGIDLLIDDYPAYCHDSGCVSLMVWPNSQLPYEAPEP